jgi:hypothetical protein
LRSLRVQRVTSLPATLIPNTLYLVDTANNDYFDIYLISLDGTRAERSMRIEDVMALVGASNGIAGLDSAGKLFLSDFPTITTADIAESGNRLYMTGQNIIDASLRTTMLTGDFIPLSDSSGVFRRVTYTNLRTSVGTWYNTLTSTLTNKTLDDPIISGYREVVVTPSAGTNFTLDPTVGTYFRLTLTGNSTVNLPASVAGRRYTVELIYNGAFTVTWAGGTAIRWPGNTAPIITSASGKADVFEFLCNGTVTRGRLAAANYNAT